MDICNGLRDSWSGKLVQTSSRSEVRGTRRNVFCHFPECQHRWFLPFELMGEKRDSSVLWSAVIPFRFPRRNIVPPRVPSTKKGSMEPWHTQLLESPTFVVHLSCDPQSIPGTPLPFPAHANPDTHTFFSRFFAFVFGWNGRSRGRHTLWVAK